MADIYLYGGETSPNNIRLRSVVSDSQSVAPTVGTLAFTAWIAGLAFTLGLQLVGYSPTVSVSIATNTTISTAIGSAVLTGQAPSLGNGLIPSAGSLALTGQISPVGNGLTPAPGALSLIGLASTISVSSASNTTIAMNPGGLILTGKVPGVVSTGGGAGTTLKQRAIRGNDETGKDDWWISYQA